MFEIGNSLREARLRQGLDFFEIEQSTKIRGKYLRALEDEQFEVLPAQTYVKGFLRSYADYLGLDGQLYVDEFNSRYVRGELEEEEEQRPFKPRVARPGRGGAFQNKARLDHARRDRRPDDASSSPPGCRAGPATRTRRCSVNTTPKKKAPPKPTAKLVASGVKGGAYVVVYRGHAHREADLRGDARERTAATGSSAAISGSTCSRPRT